MTKTKYWAMFALISAFLTSVFYAGVFSLSAVSDLTTEKVLAYAFILLGFSLFYFGFLRPHWFAKEIIPTASAVKLRIKKDISKKPSLKDDSHFWKIFPHALFFSFAGFAYLMQPQPTSILVAAGCSAWVQFLYRFI
jgi:hypothetical protein